MRLLITGATGFVGRALAAQIFEQNRFSVRCALRNLGAESGLGADQVRIGAIDATTDWRQALRGVDIVVHLAARVHVTKETVADPLAEFRSVNVAGTLNLARQAVEAGVRRFIFLSSVKVNGEGYDLSGATIETRARPYREADTPAPEDAYGLSKHEAEVGLRAIGEKSGMAIVIIRPPLVYGPAVRANFLALMRAVHRGVPLPLGAVQNRRSLVALDNLIDFILTCVEHPLAVNETFLVSDGEDLSTPALIRRLSLAMGRPARLISVPPTWILFGATVLGRRGAARRLLGSLQVDITKAQELLGWTPPVNVDTALRRTVVASGMGLGRER